LAKKEIMKLLKKYFPYLIIILILYFWFNSCERKGSQISDLEAQMGADSTAFKRELDTKGREVFTQRSTIIKQKRTLRKLVDKVNGIKSVNSQLRATIRTEARNITLVPDGEPEIIEVHDTINTTPLHYLRLPQAYGFQDKWKGLYYKIDTLGNSEIETMWFVNQPLITFGHESRKFPHNIFGAKIPVVAYRDENPFAEITSMQNFIFKPEKKWYKRKSLYFGAGIVTGIFITSRL